MTEEKIEPKEEEVKEEEVKEEPKEVVEEPKEEVAPEPKEEPKKEDEEEVAEKIAKSITALVDEKVEARDKAQKEANDRLEKMSAPSSVEKVCIYKSQKSKENSIFMEKEVAENLGRYILAVKNKDYRMADKWAVKLEVHNETTAAEGGYLVPEIWANTIVRMCDDMAVIRPISKVVQITSNSFHVPVQATNPKAEWRSESAVKASTTVEFTEIELTPYSLAAKTVLTEELSDDALIDVVSFISERLARALVTEEERTFAVGNGAGQPTGIDNYTFTQVDANFALTHGIFSRAMYTLSQCYRNNATWMMNADTIRRVVGLSDTTGQPIYNFYNSASGPTLMGRPVIEQNDLPSDRIFFGDFNEYWIAQRKGISVRTSTEASYSSNGSLVSMWEQNELGIIAEERVDAELTTTNAFVEIINVHN